MKIEAFDINASTGSFKTRVLPVYDQKIISFYWTGVVPHKKNGIGGIDGVCLNVGNTFSEQLIKWTFKGFTKQFFIENAIVEDNYGIRRKLPSRKFIIKGCVL